MWSLYSEMFGILLLTSAIFFTLGCASSYFLIPAFRPFKYLLKIRQLENENKKNKNIILKLENSTKWLPIYEKKKQALEKMLQEQNQIINQMEDEFARLSLEKRSYSTDLQIITDLSPFHATLLSRNFGIKTLKDISSLNSTHISEISQKLLIPEEKILSWKNSATQTQFPN